MGTVVFDEFLTGKAYTVTQAARLVKTSPQNVRRWLRGYTAPGHSMAPVFSRVSADEPVAISFLQLVEIAVVARYRRLDSVGQRAVPLDRLRRAHDYARQVLGVAYPFASLELRTQGGHLLHDFAVREPGAGTLALDLHGQYVLPFAVDDALQQFDYDETKTPPFQMAQRWFPFGRHVPIVIDPHVSAGRPIVAGTRVSLVIIRDRFTAGESIADLADDFELAPAVVEQALRYAA